MEDPGSYEALSVRDDPSGSSRCSEGLSCASLWWLPRREIPPACGRLGGYLMLEIFSLVGRSGQGNSKYGVVGRK